MSSIVAEPPFLTVLVLTGLIPGLDVCRHFQCDILPLHKFHNLWRKYVDFCCIILLSIVKYQVSEVLYTLSQFSDFHGIISIGDRKLQTSRGISSTTFSSRVNQ